MSLSREMLSQMKEAQLQEKVLLPLFKRKGYNDVHIHQGPTELGKDIVMWKPGDYGRRINYAVVVKAKPITGSVSASYGAGTVAAQIRQCFGSNYLDHVTGEEQTVNEVYVVCSQGISKEAISAIKAAIAEPMIERFVTYVDGDKLWEDLERYEPEKLIFTKLRDIQKILDRASPDHRLVARTTGEITIEPRRPGTTPATIQGSISLPPTPEGRAVLEDLKRHISTGSSLKIPKQFLQDLIVPDFLVPYLGGAGNNDFNLVITPSKPPPLPLLIKVEMVCDDGQNFVLEYIHLLLVQRGEDEALLNNEAQPVPWKVSVVMNKKERQFTFGLSMAFDGLNVKQVSQGLHFLDAMARGGSFRVKHFDTGLEIVRQRVIAGQFEAPWQQGMELVDSLVFIQEKTSTPISFINGPVDLEQAQAIFDTACELEKGYVDLKLQPTTITTKEFDFARLLAESKRICTPQPLTIQDPQPPEVEIMGTKIPMGPVVYTWDKVYMTDEDLRDLRSRILSHAPSGAVDIRLTPAEGCSAKALYTKWLAPEAPNACHTERDGTTDKETSV
jgi:hypothetical protein